MKRHALALVLAGVALGGVANPAGAQSQVGWSPAPPITAERRVTEAEAWRKQQRARDLPAEAEANREKAREALSAKVELERTPPGQAPSIRPEALRDRLTGCGGRRAADAVLAGDLEAASRILGDCAATASAFARALAPEARAAPRSPLGLPPPSGAAIGGQGDRNLGLSVAHPAVGMLLLDEKPGCSGTLVRPDAVLTAAHCVCPPDRYPDAASCQRSNQRDGRRWQVFFQHAGLYPVRPNGIDVPDHWNWAQKIDGDLALIRLARPVGWIAPIDVYTAPAIAAAPDMQVAGFGLRSRTTDERDSVEPGMKTVVRIKGEPCTAADGAYLDRTRQWCSPREGDGGRAFGIICQGDSGGLVLGQSGSDTVDRQIAVVSGNHVPAGVGGAVLAEHCARPEQRAFYSRLDEAAAAGFLANRLSGAAPRPNATPVPALHEAFLNTRLIAEPWRFLDPPTAAGSAVRAPRSLPDDADILATVNSPDPLTRLELWRIRPNATPQRLSCAGSQNADEAGRHVLECRVAGLRQGTQLEARIWGKDGRQSPYQIVVTALPSGTLASR